MDVQAVLSLVAVSLITAACFPGSPLNSTEPKGTSRKVNSSLDTQDTSTPSNCSCSILASSPAASATNLHLGLLQVNWTGQCQGHLKLFSDQPPSHSVCNDSYSYVRRILKAVCQERRGCKGDPRWLGGRTAVMGYLIKENGILHEESCEPLQVRCSVAAEPAEGHVQGELQTYKVMTAVLCCVLLVLLIIRFAKPTVRALQKRLSDRRQNRWIGPTQSHSVSYHREQTALRSADREQRLSYPALERLTVSDSREPSSNRNSDCNY